MVYLLCFDLCGWVHGQVLGLVEIFRARVVDVAEDSLTIEVNILSNTDFVMNSTIHFSF